MKYIRSFVLTFLIVAPSSAQALLNRAWVSGKGSDVATCGTVAAPCKTFKYVHDNIIAVGGEIDVADSGEFGPLTITKSLSVVNDGVGVANVQQATVNANAIIVNAGAAGVVHLRGLSIDGLGDRRARHFAAISGVFVHLKLCRKRFAMSGIAVINPTATKLTVSDTASSENAHSGIYVLAQASVKGSISRFLATNNGNGGVNVDAQLAPTTALVKVSVVDSVASNNGGSGYISNSLAAHAKPILSLVQATASGNVNGLFAGANAEIRVARSNVTGNSIGALISSGAIVSQANNNFADNSGGDVSGGVLGAYGQK